MFDIAYRVSLKYYWVYMQKIVFLIIIFFQFLVNAETLPSSLTIGLTAGGSPEALKKESAFFAETVQKMMNIPIKIYISKDYDSLADAVKNKKVDYAFLTASTYISAEASASMKVLLKKTWTNPYYFSALVVLKESRISQIKDFKSKKIAFVDPKSTSGYLYPKVFLQQKKIQDSDFKEIVFSGSHAASIKMLEDKKVDIVAVFSDDEHSKIGAWTRFGQLSKNKFKVIWTSQPIPNDPFVVRTEFYEQFPKVSHDLMYNLIEMQSDPAIRKKVTEIMGTGDLMPATSKQYDPVREMHRVLSQ